jgi:hypothetical protein
MKRAKLALILIGGLLAASAPGADSNSKAQAIKSFTSADSPISKQLTLDEGKSWLADCDKATTLRLFEVPEPNVDDCVVIYRAKLKTEDLKEPAYLEMWCRIPGRGEFFSRGLQNTVTGSNDWASYETPFFLKKGEKPDLIKLNVVLKGSGKIWVKDVELVKGPLPKS